MHFSSLWPPKRLPEPTDHHLVLNPPGRNPSGTHTVRGVAINTERAPASVNKLCGTLAGIVV